MAVLRWQHGTTADEARNVVQQRLQDVGYGDKVKWNGTGFSASVGWGQVLSLEGRIEEREAILEQCSGAIGGIVMGKIREILEQLCPGGEVK